MATYEYDDFRVTFTLRPRHEAGEVATTDALTYDVEAATPDGMTARATFMQPLSDDDLRRAVRTLGSTRSAVTRDIGEAVIERRVTAEQLGTTLAGALFAGEIGATYEAARTRAVAAGRGLRLRLSLADAPALLNVPWEFMYVKPTFLASQRRTPIVRFLETNSPVTPSHVEGNVRILGLIANPEGSQVLNVADERAKVDTALAKVRKDRGVDVDWLDPATPRRLRQKLQEGNYHILHFVGHSEYRDGEGVLFLEDDNGKMAQVSTSQFVNLLGDQATLRLVVLNSCEAARSDTMDPFAGLATSIVALGIPAVVAMQFEITDKAAITFAEELYHSLIARQDPIDAAVAEARKAVFTEVSEIEWATPVLFLRNDDGRLFTFAAPAVSRPQDAVRTGQLPLLPPEGGDGADGPEPSPGGIGALIKRLFASKVGLAISGVAAVVVLALVAVAVFAGNDDSAKGPSSTSAATSTSPSPTTIATPASSVVYPTVPGTKLAEWVGPRQPSGLLAVAGLEADGETHISHLASSGQGGTATSASDVDDTEPVWDPNRNVLGFTRFSSNGSDVRYVVPGFAKRPDDQPDKGIQVRKLTLFAGLPAVPEGTFDHAPVWRQDGNLLFARTRACRPGPGCAEDIILATLTRTGDLVTGVTLAVVSPDWGDVTNLSIDPSNDARFVVTGHNLTSPGQENGVWIDEIKGATLFLPGSEDANGAIFSQGGTAVIAVEPGTEDGWGSALLVWTDTTSPPQRRLAAAVLGTLAGTSGVPPDSTALLSSIVASPSELARYAVFASDRSGQSLPTIVILDANLVAVDTHPAGPAPTDAWVDLVGLAW